MAALNRFVNATRPCPWSSGPKGAIPKSLERRCHPFEYFYCSRAVCILHGEKWIVHDLPSSPLPSSLPFLVERLPFFLALPPSPSSLLASPATEIPFSNLQRRLSPPPPKLLARPFGCHSNCSLSSRLSLSYPPLLYLPHAFHSPLTLVSSRSLPFSSRGA